MLKTAHCPTGSACANVRRVSARFRHFAPLTKAPQRKRELAASGCCFVYSIRRCSVIMSIASRRGTSRTCYQNGNRSFQWFFPAGFIPKHLRLKCRGQHWWRRLVGEKALKPAGLGLRARKTEQTGTDWSLYAKNTGSCREEP